VDSAARNSAPRESLLAAAQTGDPAAFWQLADSYRPYLKAVAARLLGGRLAGKVDASDVVQQGLLVAFEQWAHFRGQNADQWQGWLLAIVRSQAKKLLRYWHQQKRDVRHERSPAADSGGGPQLAGGGSSPSQRAARREQTARLLQAVDRLPPDYREVLHLRNFEGLPFADVAARMNRSEVAVRLLWGRAIQRLRDEWGDDS
jgi:RNA polymerase sigma-70 factor (ECF subfamily)